MNIEAMLREALRQHADRAPSGAGLRDAVADRSRRWRQQRRFLSGGVAVATAVASVLIVPAFLPGIGTPDLGGSDARPGATLSPGVSPPPPEPLPRLTPTGAVTLVQAPDLQPPDFPFTPGWSPEGLLGPYQAYEVDVISALEYYDAEHTVTFNVIMRSTEIGLGLDKLKAIFESVDEDEPAEPPQPLTEQAVTVLGREARLLFNDSFGVVGWRHAPDQWLAVWGGTAEEVLRFAEALVEQPFQGATPFTFDLAPEGAVLRYTNASQVNLNSEDPNASGGTEVILLRGGPGMELNCAKSEAVYRDQGQPPYEPDGTCHLPRKPVQVGEHDGELVGDYLVLVYLDDGLALKVESVGAFALSDEDLLRFAAGIHVSPDAFPGDSP